MVVIKRFNGLEISLKYDFQCKIWEEETLKRVGHIFTETEPRVMWKPKEIFTGCQTLINKTEKGIVGKFIRFINKNCLHQPMSLRFIVFVPAFHIFVPD